MAIQIPNVGTGNAADQTGDNEWLAMKKVADNFSNTAHAASRLVGASNGNLVEITEGSIMGAGIGSSTVPTKTLNIDNVHRQPSGFYYINRQSTTVFPQENHAFVINFSTSGGTDGFKVINTPGTEVFYVQGKSVGQFASPKMLYHTGNTTKDAGTGFLKVSSPVLHLYNDKIDKIHEAEHLDIVVDKKGVGHYEIHGTTGLRQNDGWNMSPPRDIHGNVRCMIEVTEKDDVITVKTYKRKFDLELAAIVHDYENPLDIPDGACVELRFNDLPYEGLDDMQAEV